MTPAPPEPPGRDRAPRCAVIYIYYVIESCYVAIDMLINCLLSVYTDGRPLKFIDLYYKQKPPSPPCTHAPTGYQIAQARKLNGQQGFAPSSPPQSPQNARQPSQWGDFSLEQASFPDIEQKCRNAPRCICSKCTRRPDRESLAGEIVRLTREVQSHGDVTAEWLVKARNRVENLQWHCEKLQITLKLVESGDT